MPDLSLAELTAILDAPAVSSESGRARGYQSPQQWRQQLALDALEDREGLPRGLMTAVLTRESNGYPTAKSKAGAQGLFQFMPATAQSYKIDPTNPEQAANAAAKELGGHYKRYEGDLAQTLAAWNWGSGNLQKQGLANAPKETRNFITWVSGLLTPSSAEAAERPRSQGAMQTQAQTHRGPLTVEGLEQLFGTPAHSPQNAPQATQTIPPASQTPTTPLVDPRATQEPPSLSLRQPSDLVVDIEKASTPGPEPDKGLLSDLPGWGKWAAATGISTAGGLGGAALGSLGGPVGTVAGELAGSAAARWLNVKLGLEEPGLVGDIASVAVPAAFRGVGALARGGIPRLPGAGVARHEMAEEGLEALGERSGPQTASTVLFGQAAQHNAPIPTVSLWRTAGTILREQQGKNPSARNGDLMQWAQEILDLSRQHGGPIPMQRLETLRRDLGKAIKGDPDMRRLYGSIMDDLEHAVSRNVPGAAPLREGLAAYRQERALDDLTDLWSPGKGLQTLPSGEVQVYGRRILNAFERKLTDDPRFAGSFSPAELADIHETLRAVSRLAFGSPAGGSLSRRAAEVTGALVGSTLGSAAGGPMETAVGGVMGFALPAVMAYLMQTTPGRALIRQVLAEGNGRITAAGYAALSTLARKTLELAEPQRPAPAFSGSPGHWP